MVNCRKCSISQNKRAKQLISSRFLNLRFIAVNQMRELLVHFTFFWDNITEHYQPRRPGSYYFVSLMTNPGTSVCNQCVSVGPQYRTTAENAPVPVVDRM